jgi:hypothetical protein
MLRSSLRLQRRAALVLSLALACGTLLGSSGRAAAVPAADGDARRWLEMASNYIGQPDRVFRTQLNIRDRTEAGEGTTVASVWIDSSQRKSRLELRRDDVLIAVTVVDNWDVANFDAIANKVTTITVPDDRRANVQNPAYSVLTPSLIAAYQAGQINPDADVTTTPGQQVDGRDAVRLSLTLRVSQDVQVPTGDPGTGGQPPPTRTETIQLTQEYTLYLDPANGAPLQEAVRGLDKDGKEISQRTATFQNNQIVDRSTVAPDLLSLAAVQGMQASLDQQVARARGIGMPLYWLGMELPRPFTDAKGQRQTGLVLNDVLVLDQPNTPKRVVLSYGTRDEPTVPYVLILHQPRSDWDQFLSQAQGRLWFQADGVQRRPVQIQAGGQATQFELQPPPPPAGAARPGGSGAAQAPPPQLPPLLMVQIANGDGVAVVDTPPLFVEGGRQANPFLDRTQQAAIAGALARMN